MSSDNEGGSLNDWTFVQPNEGIENGEQQSEVSSGETVAVNQVQLESKIQEIEEPESHKNSDGSDIERISEEGVDECFTDSVISQASHFSFIQASEKSDVDNENLSCGSSSGVSVLADEDNCDFSNTSKDNEQLLTDFNVPVPRSYTHTPNRKLNIALSIVLILSVTLVFGVGIGHFLGWSSRWSHQYNLHQTHIVKLQALQKELSACLQNHADDGVTSTELLLCYEKVGYWKKKFQDILAENHVLQDFISKNKANIEDDVENNEQCDEVNANMVAEYRKLKFHLIGQQLENVEVLKLVEEMKKQKLEMLDGIKQLEDENKMLKAHMDENEANAEMDDNKADELLISKLSEENSELKKELAQLTVALELEEVDDTKANEEIGTLRQRINSLLNENADLQIIIARLRYAEAVQNTVHNNEQNSEALTEDSWLESTGFPDLNISGFIDNLLKIATDKEAAKKELNHLQDNLRNGYNDLSKKAKEGLHTGQHFLREMHKEFESKVAALLNSSFDSSTLSTETIRQMGNTLGNAMLKLYKIGVEGMESISTGKNDELSVTKKIGKVLQSMERQWENIRDKMWGTSKKKSHSTSGDKMTEVKRARFRSTKRRPDIPAIPKQEASTHDETRSKNKSKPKSIERQPNVPDIPKHEASKNDEIHLKNDPKNAKNLKLDIQVDDKQEEKSEVHKNSDREELDSIERNGNISSATNDWFEARAEYRESARNLDDTKPNSWVFDRASSREKSRISEMDPSNWYIQRGKERRILTDPAPSSSKKKSKNSKKSRDEDDSDDDDDDDDDHDDDEKKDKKYKKKRNEKTKSKKSSKYTKREYTSDDDDDDDQPKIHKGKRYWQKQHSNFEWQLPDSHFSL